MTAREFVPIRLGAAALVASGVLTVAGLLLRGPILDPSTQAEAFVRAAASTRHILAWSLLLPSLVIQLYGFLGLSAFLAETPQNRLAFAGAMFSIAGNGLFLPFAGIIAFVTPEVARLFLGGRSEALGAAVAGLSGGFAAPFLALSALLLLVGSVLLALAVWRSPALPRATAVPYALHSLFIGFLAPHSYALERTGGVLLLGATAWIARAMWKQTGENGRAVQPG